MRTQDTGPDEDGQIRALIDDWARAIRIKSADGVLSHYAEGWVLFSLAPPLVSATDAKGLDAWFATWRGPLGYEVSRLTISAGENVAFSHSLNRLSGTDTAGQETDMWFRHTLGFRKIGGRWKIAHEHESVPFYMDGTVRAAVDLEP
jgi:PhnB protein